MISRKVNLFLGLIALSDSRLVRRNIDICLVSRMKHRINCASFCALKRLKEMNIESSLLRIADSTLYTNSVFDVLYLKWDVKSIKADRLHFLVGILFSFSFIGGISRSHYP